MIEILLAAGADIDAGGGPNSDITPLMLAAARVCEDARYLETIKLFLKRGANLKAKTKEKKTAARWAADWRRYVTHGHVTDGEKPMLLEIIGELGRAFSRSGRKRRSSRREIDVDLMTAVFWMRPEKLAEILSRGVDVNVRSENGYTPLIANLFRIFQTEEKLKRDEVSTAIEANNTHYEVAEKIHKAIIEMGATLPEDLPKPEKSIQVVEREEIRKLRKSGKRLMLDE